MDWRSSRRGMSQIWLQVRQQSRNILESCFVLATSTNSFSQYDDFWLSFLKYGKFCSFFPNEHFVHFTGEILLKLSPQCKIWPKKKTLLTNLWCQSIKESLIHVPSLLCKQCSLFLIIFRHQLKLIRGLTAPNSTRWWGSRFKNI